MGNIFTYRLRWLGEGADSVGDECRSELSDDRLLQCNQLNSAGRTIAATNAPRCRFMYHAVIDDVTDGALREFSRRGQCRCPSLLNNREVVGPKVIVGETWRQQIKQSAQEYLKSRFI